MDYSPQSIISDDLMTPFSDKKGLTDLAGPKKVMDPRQQIWQDLAFSCAKKYFSGSTFGKTYPFLCQKNVSKQQVWQDLAFSCAQKNFRAASLARSSLFLRLNFFPSSKFGKI